MDSGKYVQGRLELHTPYRTVRELEMFNTMLTSGFGLNCGIIEQGKYHKVVIYKKSVKLLHSIVSPYILPTMRNKIGLDSNIVIRSPPLRGTSYSKGGVNKVLYTNVRLSKRLYSTLAEKI
jgi:hypothetical protein